MSRRDIIVIGASAGGVQALQAVARGLPADLDAAVFVVLHLSPHSPSYMVEILQGCTRLPVSSPPDGERVQPGRVYIAPPDHHLLLEGDRIRVTRGPKENRYRPSVDVLFRSAALVYSSRVVGVILTGNLDDGTAGLWAIKQRGGAAIVQDPAEAEQPSMPRSALAHVAVDHVAALAEVGPLLGRLAGEPVIEEGGPVSKEMEIEVRIAAEGRALQLGAMDLGPLTPYTCPECHGALVQLKEDGILRFRCHTGHAYSASSLLAEVTGHVEASLYDALRTIEESLLLLTHLARHARATQAGATDAALFEQKAEEAGRRAEAVRRLVFQHEILSPEAAAERGSPEERGAGGGH